MNENMIFTNVAKVFATISVAVGLVGVALGVDGFSGGQSLPGTQIWEAVPSIFLGAGCSLLVSGTIIGVLCEISQNISNMRKER